MSRFVFTLFLPALLAISAVHSGRAMAQQGTWFGSAGIIFLERERSPNSVLVVSTETGAAELNAKDFKFDPEAGIDINIGYWLDDDNRIFVRHFNVNDWSDTHHTTGVESHIATNPTTGEPTGPPPPTMTNIEGYYASALWSTELNFVHQYDSWYSCLVGLRLIELHEDLAIEVEDQAPMNGPEGYYAGTTSNYLYGVQVGGEGLLYNEGNLTINAVAKGGLFGLLAKQRAYYYNTRNQYAARASNSSVAFVGETGVNVAYQILENLSIQFGYQLLWINGVALAGEQVPVTNFTNPAATGLDDDSTVFYHGGFINCTATY